MKKTEISSKVTQFLKAVNLIAKGEADDLRNAIKDFPDVDVLVGYVEEFEKALAKVINKQRKAFVKIMKSPIQKADEPTTLQAVEYILTKAGKDADFSDKFSEAAKSFFDKSVPDLTSRVMDLIDKEVPFKMLSPTASLWVGTWSEDLGKLMNLTSHRALQNALQNGIDEGWGIDKIVEYMDGMKQFNRKRARVTAITEVLTSSSVAQNEAYRQSPAVTGKKWQHSGARRITPRDNHIALDGTVVDKDGKFDVGGYPAEFPRDPALPAKERVSCHCVLSPSVDEKILGLSPEEKQRIRDSVTNPDGTDPVERNPLKLPKKAPKTRSKTPKPLQTVPKRTWKDDVKDRIGKGLKTEADVREVGKIIREQGQAKVKKPIEAYLKAQTEFDRRKDVCLKMMDANKVYFPGTKTFTPEYRAVVNDYKVAQDVVEKASNDYLGKIQDTWKGLLNEVREFGHPLEQTWAEGTEPVVKKLFKDNKQFYPRDWLEHSVNSPMKGELDVRGYYQDGSGKLVLSGDKDWQRAKVLNHEMGHRFEHRVPKIKEFERQFYNRRTFGESLRRMPEYNPPEYALFDKFLTPYMGKSYGIAGFSSEAYEILSMGIESIFNASYNILDDTDFADFILGMLAGV